MSRSLIFDEYAEENSIPNPNILKDIESEQITINDNINDNNDNNNNNNDDNNNNKSFDQILLESISKTPISVRLAEKNAKFEPEREYKYYREKHMFDILNNLNDKSPIYMDSLPFVNFRYLIYFLIIIIPFIVCDIYWGFYDNSCTLEETEIGLTLGNFLQIRGIILCVGCLSVILLYSTHSHKINWDIIFYFGIFLIISVIFNIIWTIIGAYIFWHEINNNLCQENVYNYVFVSLIIRFIGIILILILIQIIVCILNIITNEYIIGGILSTIMYFIIIFPIIFTDLYYSVNSHTDLTNSYFIGLDIYLILSAIFGICKFIIYFIITFYYVEDLKLIESYDKPSNQYVMIRNVFKFLNIINIGWNIIGGIIFWSDKTDLSNKLDIDVYYYIQVSLIIKYIKTFLSLCYNFGKLFKPDIDY